MYFSTACGLAASLAMVSASPLQARTATTSITFNGAAGASYTIPNVPLDGTVTYTNNVLSISSINANIDVANDCQFVTNPAVPPVLVKQPDGSFTVGPPEQIVSIACKVPSSPPPPSSSYITLEFDGANPSTDPNAKYTLTVPLNNSPVSTNNVLSITDVVASYPFDVAHKCTLTGINGVPVLVATSSTRFQVGPPQQILSVKCSS